MFGADRWGSFLLEEAKGMWRSVGDVLSFFPSFFLSFVAMRDSRELLYDE